MNPLRFLRLRLPRPGILALIAAFGPAALGAGLLRAAEQVESAPGVGLTVYNQDFAIVKERRPLDLKSGAQTVRFPDVAATIVPESVQFSSLVPAGDAQVLEQNYEFDLVSADKLLAKHVDKRIGVVTRDGGLTEGTLLSADPAQLVLAGPDGIDLLPRGRNVKDIRLASLPAGLLTRPTLVWKVKAAKPGEHLVEVAYQAHRINWRVDYRAVASANEKTIDLAGWVTITNQTGATFKDAGLKLMAGDVHVVRRDTRGQSAGAVELYTVAKGVYETFQEKSFAEYHLYTLGRQTTLANAQTKQIELVKVEAIPVVKRYLLKTPPSLLNAQPGSSGQTQPVAVILEFKNSKATRPGLGIPLPKGPFRVYQTDADGQVQFIGRDEIDHTPKDEPVRIRIGSAFDLVAERVRTANRTRAGESWNEEDWKITLRSHKDEPVSVVVEEPLRGDANWEILRSSQAYRKKDFHTLEFTVDLPPNAERNITYTVRYTW